MALSSWRRFWHGQASSEALGLFRLLFVGTWVVKWLGTWGIYKGWDAFRFGFPHHQAYSYGRFANAVPGFEWLGQPTRAELRDLETAMLVFGILFCLGVATRLSGLFTAASALFYLLSSQFNYLHHINIYAWMLTLLALSPCGDHFSVDAWLRRRRGKPPPPERPMTFHRLLQAVVCGVYFSSAVAKASPVWLDGSLMAELSERGWVKGVWKEPLLGLVPIELFGPFTLFAEGLLAFGLWVPRLRLFTALTGVALHLGIDALMDVTTFSYAMITTYVLWLWPAWRARRGGGPR